MQQGNRLELASGWWENVPQPGYIGVAYENTGILLVGQNPAIPPAKLQRKDKDYTAALRALRDAPTPKHYGELQAILDDFISTWPVKGQYFPLEECRLTLMDVAYFNFVRCRTMSVKANAPPCSRWARGTVFLG